MSLSAAVPHNYFSFFFFFFKVDHKEAGQTSLEKAGQWVFMRQSWARSAVVLPDGMAWHLWPRLGINPMCVCTHTLCLSKI